MTFQRWEMLLFLSLLIPYTAAVISAYRRAKKEYASVCREDLHPRSIRRGNSPAAPVRAGGFPLGGRYIHPPKKGLGFSARWTGCSIAAGAALAGLVLALAGPVWGECAVERTYRGKQAVFCIDISNSMTVSDIGPSRLGRVKEFVSRVLAESPGLDAGVAVFKGAGELAMPVTGDRSAVTGFIDSLSPDLQTVPGTNIESGLAEAVTAFPPHSPKKGYLFLFTDGESTAGNPLLAEEDVRDRNIDILVFCAGTEEGTNLRLETGEVRTVQANPADLRRLADACGGEFYMLGADNLWAEYSAGMAAAGGAENGETGTFTRTETVPKEQYHLFLGMVFFVAAAYGVFRIWP